MTFVVYSWHKEEQLAGKCPAYTYSEVEAKTYVVCKLMSVREQVTRKTGVASVLLNPGFVGA